MFVSILGSVRQFYDMIYFRGLVDWLIVNITELVPRTERYLLRHKITVKNNGQTKFWEELGQDNLNRRVLRINDWIMAELSVKLVYIFPIDRIVFFLVFFFLLVNRQKIDRKSVL